MFQRNDLGFLLRKRIHSGNGKRNTRSFGQGFHIWIDSFGRRTFEPENQKVLTPFLRKVKERFPEKNIWCYSGYIYETDLLAKDGKSHTESTDEMLSYIDTLVDGPFIEAEKDISLVFRGSKNQRILKLH